MTEPVSGAPVSPAQQRRGVVLALLVAGAYFMENLDGTVITTAVPDIARTFGVAPLELNIGVSAYLLTLGVFIPISGWIAERFGSRKVFALALTIFTLASMACGLADGLAEFVWLRALQGAGGALMVPVGRLLVLNNTPKERLIQVIATLTWPALVAPVLGPPLGGFITSYFTWRWIFYLNLPLGLIALYLAWRLIPEQAPAPRRPFDWPGFALSGAAVFCLTWAAEQLSRPEASWLEAGGFLGASAIFLILDVLHLRRSRTPLIDLSALEIPTFSVTIFGGSLFRMAISAVPFLLPLMFQVGFGLDAFHSGLLVIAVFAGNLTMKPATTGILRRFGFRPVLVANGVLNVVSLAACALLGPSTPIWIIATVLFIGGLTRSMQFTAFNTLAFADMPQDRMATANTLFSTAFQVAIGLGIALGAVGVRAGHWLAQQLHLTALPAAEYRLAFLLVAATALLGLLDSLKLADQAGAHIANAGKRAS